MNDKRNYDLIHAMISTNRMHKKAIETVIDGTGIHRSRHLLLMNLAKREKFTSQKEIADGIGITQAAMTVSLATLERDGLVKKTAGCDNRYNEISITEKGREIVEHSREHFARVDAAVFDGFSDGELEVLSGYLERMKANLQNLLDRRDEI